MSGGTEKRALQRQPVTGIEAEPAPQFADPAAALQPQIRFIEGRECLAAESLWRQVFCEDSQAFTDYYFREKAPKNRGFVAEQGTETVAMLYLTPEKMQAAGSLVMSAYIVGVATRQDCRHRGYMAALLQHAFAKLYTEKMPFVFLMPASEAIYRPFGFRFIYDRPIWPGESLKKEKLQAMGREDAERMAAFAQRFLAEEKAVYICRDGAYYKQQIEELAAQSGGICGWYDRQGNLAGLCMYAEEDGATEIIEVLARPEEETAFIRRDTEKKPIIMARIVHLPAMLELIKSRREFQLILQVEDGQISENNGRFFCCFTPAGCRAERIEGELPENVPVLALSAAELVQILFGYPTERSAAKSTVYMENATCVQSAESGQNAVQEQREAALHMLQAELLPLSPVWINEIV